MDRNSLPANVVDALRRGNKIEAIKLLREATHIGLAEAKGVIDALEAHGKATRAATGGAAPAKALPAKQVAVAHAHRRPREDDLSPGEVPRNSLGPAAIVIVLAVAALAFWLYLRG